MRDDHFRTVIVGGGPAGLAPLVAASRDGRLGRLLAAGLAVVEGGPAIGGGRLGRYAINSDSTAETFLTAVKDHVDPRLMRLADSPLCRELATQGRGAVPLARAGEFMVAIGTILTAAITQAGGAALTGHEALHATRTCDGGWILALRRLSDDAAVTITADSVLIATGGTQTLAQVATDEVAGRALLPTYADTIVLSDDALQPAGLAQIRARLARRPAPKVAIVGGSTSALAAAGLLLKGCGDILAAPGSISVLHRRPMRLFYPTPEAARADGYTDFNADDLCPVSGFVYRLAGMRLDSRDLLMRLLGVGGAAPEPRVRLHRITQQDDGDAAHALLAGADVIIAALGYRPRALPLFDEGGRPIVARGTVGRGRMVDRLCRVCDMAGEPVPGVFGIGLAAGFVPYDALGGEPSFVGQANGLWLWQNAVGSLVVDGLMAHRAPAIATDMPTDDATPALLPVRSLA